MSRYVMVIVVDLDESFPEHDADVLKGRVTELLADECLSPDSSTFRLIEEAK